MLRYGSREDIMRMFGDMEKQVRMLIEDIIQITYYMRGAVQYNDMLYRMTFAERQMMADFIKERLEYESKRINPIY